MQTVKSSAESKNWVQDILGTEKQKRVGGGVVTEIGIAFFLGDKPHTLWATKNQPLTELALTAAKFGSRSMEETYQVKLDDIDKTVYVTQYHSRQLFGAVEALSLGDTVDVYAARTATGKVAFCYKPLKGV